MQSEAELESPETVIDGEFVEVTSDISAPVKSVLEEAKRTLKETFTGRCEITDGEWDYGEHVIA
ncbi:hypothetical protein [Lacrimispora sp.]|uniref:hypothetical protein n=1 Tax=Lacrimispora sp. TaxID=2719234 RepID=UPI002FDA0D7D